MNPESSDSLHISIEGEILFPHGSPQNQSTKKIKTNDELNQKHRSRRAFSFSKFIGSTLDDKNEDKKEFQYTTNEQTCDQAPAIQSHFKWIQPLLNFRTLFKTRKKAVSLPEKERTVLISEHDSQKEAMFSCYNAFKNTEIQTTLDSLKESIDSDLLQKSTIRLIHYKHQDGVSKPLKPLNKPWIDCNNKENRQLMIKAESDKNLGKNVNKMSENSQAANVLASKQIRADKGDRGLMPDPLNTESISRSFYEQKVYMAGDDTSANCAPGIYLNSEISRLFNSLRAKADHEKSRFYVATNAKSHTFPDFELASQISINEISERSLSEEDSTNGPLSSFIEDPAKEISERCDHKQSRSHSSLANYYEDTNEANVAKGQMDYWKENLRLTSSPVSEVDSDDTNIVEKSTSLVSPSLEFNEAHKPQEVEEYFLRNGLTIEGLQNMELIDPKNGFRLVPQLVAESGNHESTTLKFHSKAKVLIYNHDSDCRSIRKVFSLQKNHDSSPLKRINQSISRRFSGLSINPSTSESKANLSMHSRRDRSILKNKVNVNEEQESVRASNCDEVQVEDFLCFFETHERRRMDTEPFLEHYREKQIENYYENI